MPKKKTQPPTAPWALVLKVAQVVLADGNLVEWLSGQGLDAAELETLRQSLKRGSVAPTTNPAACPLAKRPRVRVVAPNADALADPYVLGHVDELQLDKAVLAQHWRAWNAAHPNPDPTSEGVTLTHFEKWLEWLEAEHHYFQLLVAERPWCADDEPQV